LTRAAPPSENTARMPVGISFDTGTDTVPTLSEIRAQIDALQKQEKAIVTQEKNLVIANIKQQIRDFNITAAELGMDASRSSAGGKASRPAAAERVVRYRRGDDTWTGGRGRKPQWVQQITEAGEDIEKYRVG